MITSYPSFHAKIVTLCSTSGSNKVNLENSELSWTLADESAAGTAGHNGQVLCVSLQKVLQNNSVLSNLPKLKLSC